MYELMWRVLTWPVASFSGSGLSRAVMLGIGDTARIDRIMGAIVCGFLAGGVWLMLSSTLRYLAEK